jgi:hypothetical protein
MSSESEQLKSAPHITGAMSKTRIMQYTFAALLVITIVTAILWFPVTCPTEMQLQTYPTLTGIWQMPLGAILLINALIALGVAVGLDVFISKVASDSQLNIWSSAVFALIVTLSFSLGIPSMVMGMGDVMPISTFAAPNAFVFIALVALVGEVVFKKVLGAGKKPVNPAAAAKFLIFLPFLFTFLLPKEHYASLETGGIGMPLLAGPLGAGTDPVGTNGLASFTSYLQSCYANPSLAELPDVTQLMILDKFHGWPGGASSILVIIVGIALFALAHRYFKWKITGAYFASIVVMSVIMSLVYEDADLTSR